MSRRAPMLLLLVAAALASGCTKTTNKRLYFATEEVGRLDGLRRGETIAVGTTSGDVVEITSDTTLRFTEDGGPAYKLRCETIAVDGALLTCANGPGTERLIDLNRTRAFVLIRKEQRAWGKTALYVLGFYLVVGLIAGLSS